MSNTVSSTNMALPVPIVGVEVGPAWASDLNACLGLIDSHTHATGYGALVTPSGLSISADLSFISNNATSLRTARFATQSAALALSTDVRCLYAVGNELYYNDGNGTAVPITLNGSVTGSAGTITGLPSGTASASYSAGAGSFVFQSATNKSAYIDCSSVIIRNFSTSSFGCTLAAPAAMAGDITITLPTIPASTLPLSISNAGLISAAQVTGTQIANITITDSNIAVGTITGAKISGSAGITKAQLAAVGQQLSSSSGTFSTSSVTPVDITNLTVTITTTGRPVYIAVIADGGAGLTTFNISDSAANAIGEFYIKRGGTVVSYVRVGGSQISTIMPASLNYIDIVAAGTYTYKIQCNAYVGTTSVITTAAKLIAYEL